MGSRWLQVSIRRLAQRLDLGHLDAHFDKRRKNGKAVRKCDTRQPGQDTGIDCMGGRKRLQGRWCFCAGNRSAGNRTIVTPSRRQGNPGARRCRRRCLCLAHRSAMAGAVRFTDSVANIGEQLVIGPIEQLAQMAQAFMRPPDRGPIGKQVGTERDRLLGNAPGEEAATKLDRRLFGWKGSHVPGNSGTSHEEIPCRFESKPVGHDRHAFIEEL
ncbi:hypothetical protein C8D77_10280 [Mesorhizobium loti]|uniref:Uncharacterized protein n=1 Tax=Rhizobium loti TaxID=381 RepID=A0A8E2WDN1_RHILI|nr:hypothetical protein C8D77_10280 [Mesorhizobium loti]